MILKLLSSAVDIPKQFPLEQICDAEHLSSEIHPVINVEDFDYLRWLIAKRYSLASYSMKHIVPFSK